MESTPEDRTLRVRCARCGTEQIASQRDCTTCGSDLSAQPLPASSGSNDPSADGCPAPSPQMAEALPEISTPRGRGDLLTVESGARPESFATRVTATVLMGLVAVVSLGLGIWLSLGVRPASPTRSEVESSVRVIASRVEQRRKETGLYPDAAAWQSWVAPGTAPFIDPWGRPYLYRLQPDAYFVSTQGSDGEPGGSGENEDLTFGFRISSGKGTGRLP